ncbi:MAG: DUF4003 family protein [Clostridiaceae bacterium]
MELELQSKVDSMINNFRILKEAFPWNNYFTNHFGAMYHVIKEENVEVEDLERIKEYLKDEIGRFSYFRGMNEGFFINLLYFQDDYRGFFKNTLTVYDKLRKVGFSRNNYLPLAAYTINAEVPFDMHDITIDRTKKFFQRMKKNHFWLTNTEDYIFAAMLAITDKDIDTTMESVEACYKGLNERGFSKGNTLQAISNTLAISDKPDEEKVARVIGFNNEFKKQKIKLGHFAGYLLGIISLINVEIEKVVQDIKEIDQYLYKTKGYGFWSLDKDMRMVLSISLATNKYMKEVEIGVIQATIGNSINAMIIAQQSAMIAACSASAASAASGNS